MSEDRPAEMTDPNEQKIWDTLIDMIVKSSEMVQKIQFVKYKLRHHLETNKFANEYNSLNSKNSLTNLSNILAKMIDDFRKYYLSQVRAINKIQTSHKDRARIEIMLDTAKTNLKKILAYAELHEPTFNELEKQISNLSPDSSKAKIPTDNNIHQQK